MSSSKPPAWSVLGDTVTCIVSGKVTGGSHALFEVVSPVGNGPPPHVHRREDETFYVLAGEVEFQTQGKTIRLGPGGSLFAPRNIPHSFRSVGSTPARMLLLATPAGMEEFFAELDREIGARPPEMPKLLAILGRQGIELVGAPPK